MHLVKIILHVVTVMYGSFDKSLNNVYPMHMYIAI